MSDAQAADLEAGEANTNYTSSTEDDPSIREAVATGAAAEGALASDEALQALREKLTGG